MLGVVIACEEVMIMYSNHSQRNYTRTGLAI